MRFLLFLLSASCALGQVTLTFFDQGAIVGADFKANARVATTANITIATGLNAGDTVNGVVLAADDRVLVAFQTAAEFNGIYIAGTTPTRATDSDTWAELAGAIVGVSEGTLYGGSLWMNQNAAGVGVLGTNDVLYQIVGLNSSNSTDDPTNADAGKAALFYADGHLRSVMEMRVKHDTDTSYQSMRVGQWYYKADGWAAAGGLLWPDDIGDGGSGTAATRGWTETTFAGSPGALGGVTPGSAAFTTISATDQITSTLATGTPPFVIASTTEVANLKAATATTATNLSGGTVSATTGAFSGQLSGSANGAASTPAGTLTGTWFSGGSATTTKPQFLVQPSAATSTGWSTSGTGIGVNAASGFAGRLLDLQINGVSVSSISSAGDVAIAGGLNSTGATTAARFVGGTQALSGAGAANTSSSVTKITSTGSDDAITLANGSDGQVKTVLHDVDGGSFILTPTTRNGWASYRSTVVGESITMVYVTTRGWTITGTYLGVVTP